MAVMTKKTTSRDELRRIDDAIEESILNASSADLRDELAAQGDDAAKVISDIGAIVERAKANAAKMRFDQAKRELTSFKEKSNVTTFDREAARVRLGTMKSAGPGNAPEMMMAARKGTGLSKSDEDGVLDDLAQLQALEAEEPEAGEE
jgi:hypothetical protein